jgi:hypothetical protein
MAMAMGDERAHGAGFEVLDAKHKQKSPRARASVALMCFP